MAGPIQLILIGTMQKLGVHPGAGVHDINVPYNRNLLLGPTPDRGVSALRKES